MSRAKKFLKFKKCPECRKLLPRSKFYFQKSRGNLSGYCIKCDNKKSAERRKKHPKYQYDYNKKYYLENRDKILEHNRQWVKKNMKSNLEYKNKWKKDKYKNSPIHKLKELLRSRFKTALVIKNIKKNIRILDNIGCNVVQLKKHLESQFQPGMTWKNHGKWHVDHIKPLATARTEDQLKKLFHYTNLQPLWAKDNLKKKDNWKDNRHKVRIK